MILGRMLGQPKVRRVRHPMQIAVGLAVLGVACGTGASPPPIAAVEPTGTSALVGALTPTATAAPAAAGAPADAPASVFQFPPTRTPRPTVTPIPRAEGDMTQAVLYNHTATLLEDGRVLVAGGRTATVGDFAFAGLATAEIYDPSTGRWSQTGPMFEPRFFHAAVLIESGRVLVSGSLTGEYELGGADGRVTWMGSVASAEIYEPSTEKWSLVGDMPEETGQHLLEMLENGEALAIGGLGASAAEYDPTSGTWTSVGEATSRNFDARSWQSAALLAGGRVLFIGGLAGNAPIDSVEIYDPVAGSWSPTGSTTEPRARSTVAELADGRVLISGGRGGRGTLSSAEIYDPSSETWSGAGQMATPRYEHTATVLSDGRVLVVGGAASGATEIYDPSAGGWSKAVSTLEPRDRHTATLLSDGRVLVVGGASGTSRQPFPATSAEVYDPVVDTWTPSTEAGR